MDVKQMHAFLGKLKENNSKEWMDAHKQEYQTARLNFIDLVQDAINRREFGDVLFRTAINLLGQIGVF